MNAAVSLNDLRVPPGNKLEALQGDRQGQHSIRINDRASDLFCLVGARSICG
nr:type II toxin-antitoxin system RelE/ParE family toxin [Chroococcidiopsis sp. [FACHB-1243]]